MHQHATSIYSLERPAVEVPMFKEDHDLEKDDEEDVDISWADIIFLPFYLWWEVLIAIIVCVKCIFAPLTALDAPLFCNKSSLDLVGHVILIYSYIGDTLYAIDIVLHIIHRQVSDEAKKKEFKPRNACLILIDILCMVPFYELFAKHGRCKDIRSLNIWPNILEFTETLCIYRIADIFSLYSTHSYIKLIMGYVIILLLMLNAFTCLFLLITYNGLCDDCNSNKYDWRGTFKMMKYGDANNTFHVYFYALSLISSRIVNDAFTTTIPQTYIEYLCEFFILIFMCLLREFIIVPKLFSESTYHLTQMFSFHYRAKWIIAETKRRNPLSLAHETVENYYRMSWARQDGVTSTPKAISKLPSCIRTNIYQDLMWPVFYHSPTLRNTSSSFKRWLSGNIVLHFKLPQERLYEGAHCYTDLYYIKSGIVQIISAEDSSSPLLSFTSGTILGDVNFLVPLTNKKVIVRCLTYCEIFTLSRTHLLKSLQKFPRDSRFIKGLVRGRLQHARDLFECKSAIRGTDRSEDEGLAYIKRRWWVISETVQRWKQSSSRKKHKCEIPPEENDYHCSKYIGQLVLCDSTKMRLKSAFTKETFPWILAPHSNFSLAWYRIVLTIVFISLIILPPYIARQPVTNSVWFCNLLMIIDIVYAVDVLISLVTTRVGYEHETRLSSVMFGRCCTTYFILDALSLSCVAHFVTMITSNQKYHQMAQYCRLIKSYMLFVEKYKKKWAKGQDPLRKIFFLAVVLYACMYYVISFIVYWYVKLTPGLVVEHYFVGPACVKTDKCSETEENYKDISKLGVFSIPLGYWLIALFPKSMKISHSSIYDYGMHLTLDLMYQIVFYSLSGLCMAAAYLHYEEKFRYKIIATKIMKYYKHLNLHPDLLTRLKRYLEFHWKYFNGMDIIHRKWLKEEPYDIYWKFHGSVAEKAIEESMEFKGADFGLIRALAQKSKFTKYPKNSTLILFGYPIENVFWLLNGTVKCVFQNEKSETVNKYISNGNMLGVGAIFFELPAQRTFFAATDCEVLSLRQQEFFETLKKHPDEWYLFEKCIKELKSSYTRVYQEYMSKHEIYELAMRDRIYHAKYLKQEEEEEFQKRSSVAPEKSKKTRKTKLLRYFKEFRTNPESRATFHWMTLRAFIVVVSITTTAIQGAVTASWFNRLENVKLICDIFASLDISIKTFMPYYDSKGIIVSNISKCAKHYMSRGFCMDMIGVILSRTILIKLILSKVTFEVARDLEIFLKFSHLYLLTGYFDYLADSPLTSSIIVIFVKWQLVLILAGVSVAVVLVNTCVRYQFDKNDVVTSISYFPKTCFISSHHYIDDAQLDLKNTQTLYMASLEFAKGMFNKEYFGNYNVFAWPNTLISVVTLNIVYVYYYYFCIVLLIAIFRSTSVYQDKIEHLISFLKSERVDESVIDKTLNYFMYHSRRTEGADDALLLIGRIGTMLTQDLTHYFYYNTLGIADKLLGGGEILQRQLASSVQMVVFPPGEDIIREMDLCQHVYFVHRGHVNVLKNKEVTSLKKGSIFGLLDGKKPRAARTTMQSVDYVDLLQIPADIFQEYINDTVRENIVQTASYKDDYLAVLMDVPESPTDSIQYILRGLKTIKLPFMKESVTSETSKWFSRWLLLVWVINPILANVLSYASFTIRVEPNTRRIIGVIFKILPVCDAIHVMFMISEFFTLETVVVKDRCVQKYIRWKQFKNWERYLDIVSLVLPLFTYIDNKAGHGWAKIFRIYYIYRYRVEMSNTIYKKKANPQMFNIVVALLCLYLCNCMWKYIACDRSEIKFPLFPQGFEWDKKEWQHPFSFPNGSCKVLKKWDNKTDEMIFVVAKDWRIDYVIPLLYGFTMLVGYDDNFMFSLNLKHIYNKILLWYFLKLISLFLISTSINIMYSKYQAKNVFDFKIATLLHFMQRNNASKLLIEMTKNYTNRMWQRSKGHWLPTLAQEAPLCFREDLFGALYMHHLQRPLLFQKLPEYILRQLVVRLKRTVIYPGHWVVKGGDNVSIMYFIHEGDVEQWTSNETGNNNMLTLLSTTSYFGLMPGLFPNTAYTYSYYTRSIVDFIYLEYTSWIDLINGYPDVKREFYVAAKSMSKHFAKI